MTFSSIRSSRSLFAVISLAAVALIACSSGPPPAAQAPVSTPESAPGHDHAGHDHGSTGTSMVDGGALTTTYVCPMHPEVTSTSPGVCPKCNMKLVPKK